MCNFLCACLQQRYSQHEKKFAEANMRLTEEYKRITEHFKDLQAKFSHFQQADLNKYQAVSHDLLTYTHFCLSSCVSICGFFSLRLCWCLHACAWLL